MNDDERKYSATAGIVLCLLCLLFLLGCSSTPCVPTVEIQEQLVEVPCIRAITPVECEDYQEIPAFNVEFSDLEKKEWALQAQAIIDANKARREACITALRMQIVEHNELEPQCN